jgi:hypothetical protein
MSAVLAEEANQTILRGMLYQVYRAGTCTAASVAAGGGDRWDYQIGSITFPHKDRGWQSTLFLHAWRGLAADGKRWLEVTVLDETQQPDAAQLVGALRTILAGVKAGVAQPTSQ